MHTFALAPILLYVLLGLLCLLLGALVFLIVRLRAAQRRQSSPTPGQPAAARMAATDPGVTVVPVLQLRRSFARAVKHLKVHVGRAYRYQSPWFMLLGEAGSGKTTLLGGTGLSLPFGSPEVEKDGRKAACTWWFFDQGIVLDLAGDYVLRADGSTADTRGWQACLRLLQRYRAERPIDGIILTIPCTDLVGPAEHSTTRLTRAAHKATLLYDRLWQAQRTLGLCVPVYVLVTQCDRISGFQSFCQVIPPHLQQDMLGWSSPYTLDAAYASHWIDEAFDMLYGQLSQLQLEVMVDGLAGRSGDEFFLFPSAFQALREPLRAYLDHLCAPSVYHEAFFFRGLYFCGDAGPAEPVPSPLVLSAEATEPVAETSAVSALPATSTRRQPVFLKQLLAGKIFPEHRLARPTLHTLVPRRRLILAAQVLLAGVMLVGGIGMWRSYSRLQREKTVLQPVFQDIAVDLKQLRSNMPMDRALFEKETVHLLQGMSRISTSHLSSVFFPSSWFDTLHLDMVDAITQAYTKIIMKSMFDAFDQRAQSLISLSVLQVERETGDPRGFAVERTSEFGALRRFVEDIVELEKHIALYNDLAKAGADDLQHLGQVIRYLFRVELPPDFYTNATYYEEALARSSGQTLRPATYREPATTKALSLATRMYDRLLVPHAVLASARALEEALERFSRQRPSDTSLGALRQLLDLITQTQTLLARPEHAWLANTALDLGEPMERLLAAIAGSAFLGPEVSTGVQKAGEAALQQFKAALKAPRPSLTRSLLQTAGDGMHLELVPSVQTLKETLEHFFSLEPIKREAQRTLRTELVPRTHLIWDTGVLEEAIKLYEPYQRFRSEAFKQLPPDVARWVEAAAVRQLRANLSDLMAQAQIFAPVPDGFGRARVEAGIGPEIRNLQGAAPALGRLVDICHEMGLDDASWALLTLVTTQAHSLLEAVEQLLDSEQPYAIKDGNFAWWNGTVPPFLGAFNVRDTKELAAYLTLQRDRIKYIARTYAEPVVAFLVNRPRQRTPQQELLLAKWYGILTELEQYDNKKPGNAIAVLDTFVLQETEPLNAHNCLQILTPRRMAEATGDFFSQQRDSLHRELYKHCQVLTQDLVVQEYTRIAQLFNQRLAGKFPFSEDAPGDSDTEADPQAVRDFYRVFDQSAKTARELLQSGVRFAVARDQALAFLAQAEAARTFFAAFLDGETQQPVPTFDLAIDFRVNKSRERGGNQIIDWQLSVGEQHIRTRDPERQGRWRVGEPIRVVLRWAKDAPVEPLVNGEAPRVEVDNHTVIYTYTNRWSLFHLLRDRASSAADFERFVDPKPHTLKFVTQTRAKQDGRPQSEAPSSAETRVFIGVTVMAQGKTLVLPSLPVRAPELLAVSRQ